MTRKDDLRRAKAVEIIRDELFAHEDTLNTIGPVKSLVLGTCDAKARTILLALREAGMVLVPEELLRMIIEDRLRAARDGILVAITAHEKEADDAD